MLLRSLLDSRFRTFATPRLITWIYRGCLLVVALMTAWWVLVALIVMSWRNGWFWGLLLLILAPIIGVILLLCVRVAAELVVIRFRAAEPVPSDPAGEPSASPASAEPLVSRAAEAARSVIRTLRQGGNVSDPSGPAASGPSERPTEGAAEGLDPAPASQPVIEHPAEGLGAGLDQEWGDDVSGGHERPSRLWVVGLAGAAVLLVLVALTVVVGSSGGGDDDGDRAAAPVRTVTVSASATPSSSVPGTAPAAPAPTASATSPAASPGPVEVWHGTVTVNGPGAERDFDATPPRQDIPNADVRGDWLRPLLVGLSGTQLAVTSGHPDATACRDAVSATGDSKTERLSVGDVVCLMTSGDRVARLITQRAEQTSTSPRMTFDAVVWQVAP